MVGGDVYKLVWRNQILDIFDAADMERFIF